MGQYDIFVIGGLALAAGYFLIVNPTYLQNLFPPASGTPTDGTTDGTDDTGNGDGKSGGGGSSTCKNYCNNCACKSYNEKCSGSCSNCKGGNRIPSKCGGGSGGTFSGVGGNTSGNSSKAADCKKYCNNGWCDSYRKRGCSGACYACSGIGSRTCTEKVINSNCAGDCKSSCWRSRATVSGVSKIVQVCVSAPISASGCTKARSAFLNKYANVAHAFETYPYDYDRISTW